MDIKDLEQFFKNLTPQEQTALIERLNRIDLATKINTDKEFLKEVLIELGNDYPTLKEHMKDTIYLE